MDILMLEAKKRQLEREIESLERKKKGFESKLADEMTDESGLMESLSKLNFERETKIGQVQKVRQEFSSLTTWYQNQRKIFNQKLGREVDQLLDEILELENMLATKQITFQEYELGLQNKEKQLKEKETELEDKNNELEEKELRARKEQKNAEGMILELKFWKEELDEKVQSLGTRENILKGKEKAVVEHSTTLEIRIQDFKGKSGDWSKKFEAKRKLVSGLQEIFEQREKTMNELFNYIENEKLLIQDQRDALNLAWAELMKLKGQNG